ncbi:MAG: FtsX-like permease family protein [Verrucomicrobiota bacterium]
MKIFLLILKHSLRHFSRHKTLTLLNILGVALGISVFVSIKITNSSANSSFRSSIDLVSGKANFTIDGHGTPFSDSLYPTILEQPQILAATPIIEKIITLPNHPGEHLRFLGIDPISNKPFNTFLIQPTDNSSEAQPFFTQPNAIILSKTLAKRLNLKIGQTLETKFGGRRHAFMLHKTIDFSQDSVSSNENIALIDIAHAQSLFGLTKPEGKLHRIDCLVKGKGKDLISNIQLLKEQLSDHLPPHVTANSPKMRSEQAEKMIGAFQLNLLALSMIALMVGMFLIYNTVAVSVIQRRTEIGILRALGLQRYEIQSLFILEAVIAGIPGILIGIIGGYWLSQYLVTGVSKSITSLYMILQMESAQIDSNNILITILTGLLAIILAAWLPAREASRVEPVQAINFGHLRQKTKLAILRFTNIGIGLLILATLTGWVSVNSRLPWLSFVCSFCALLGLAFLVPICCNSIHHIYSALSKKLTSHHPILNLGHQFFISSLHRHAISISALVSALSMMIGMSIMIYSFRETVTSWIDRTIQADIYVTSIANIELNTPNPLPDNTIQAVRKNSNIKELNTYREIKIPYPPNSDENMMTQVSATNLEIMNEYHPPRILSSISDNPLKRAVEGNSVFISDTFAKRFSHQPGDTLTLHTPSGIKSPKVIAIYNDYDTEQGVILMDIQLFHNWWQTDDVNSLAIYLHDTSESQKTQIKLRERLSSQGNFVTFSNHQLRTKAMHIFDQTFSVTYILRFIALLVAGLGIFLTLYLLASERSREIGIIRSTGGARMQVIHIILIEASHIAIVGSFLGLIGGFLLAYILDNVVNVAFFRWTIEWHTPWSVIMQTPFWVLVIALVAALYPAYKAAHLDIATALRSE